MHTPAPPLETPAKRSLDRAAADSLRDAIMRGVFPPGARLTELRLAEQLSLSRGTVRAALHRLATEGLVVQQPYTGWHVMSLTARDAWEISTLRGNLEGLAARLAAERIDDAGRQKLMQAFDRLEQAAAQGAERDINAADQDLHRCIVALADHRRLAEHYEPVTHQIRVYIAASTAIQPEYSVICQRHRSIVDAICAGLGAEAEALARMHCLNSGKELEARLRRQEEAATETA